MATLGGNYKIFGMRTMQEWLDAYGVSHQNPTNKTIHWWCVPTIFFSIIGLLSLIPIPLFDVATEGWAPYVHLGTVLILFGIFFFARLSLPITIGMMVVSAIILYAVKWVNINLADLSLFIYLGLFVAAWIVQFIGHKIEGQKPSFIDDLKFLLIGPAWLLHFIYKKLGISY